MTICRRTLLLGALLILAGASGVERAHAQRTTAADFDAGRSHFDSGVEYYRDGDLKAALIEFKRAYAASPNYRVLYNLGQVSNELSDYTEAQRYFRRYLVDGEGNIDPARKYEVQVTLVKLAGRIATLVLTSNVAGAELFVDDVFVGTSPMAEPVRVSIGTRRLAAAVSGRPRVTRVIEAAGGETLAVQLEIPPAPSMQAQGPRRVDRERTDSSAEGLGASLWLGIGSGVLAAGSGVMGYLAAVDGSKYHDALQRRTTARELETLRDRAATKALVTDILLGATVVAATITLVVALQGGGQEVPAPLARETPRAHLTLGVGSLQLTGHID